MSESEKTSLRAWARRNPAVSDALLAALAMVIVGYGFYGVSRDDLDIPTLPGRHHHATRHHHFHGVSAWLAFAGLLCIGASFAILLYRRREANPGGKADQRLPVGLALTGFAIIVVMQIADWLGAA